MNERISVIVPCRNGASTIGKCLQAIYQSTDAPLEVIVVDDGSQDDSLAVMAPYPCRVIRLSEPRGASRARNVGAAHSHGSILFFTDADCLLQPDTLDRVAAAMKESPKAAIVGGTYTPLSHDGTFFGDFQSLFIHDAETRRLQNPDYVATHAMAIRARTFKESSGFREDFLPILEDVEFSHRMRRAGTRLSMDPTILVAHIFSFSLASSLRNAVRKSRYWTLYSLGNRDLLADSGTASLGLKASFASLVLLGLLLVAWLGSGKSFYLYAATLPVMPTVVLNRNLFRSFYRAKGAAFMIVAVLYYSTLYTMAAGLGALMGVFHYLRRQLTGTAPVTDPTITVSSEMQR